MSANTELTVDKGTKTNAPNTTGGFGVFGSLPLAGVSNKKDAAPVPMNVDKKQGNATLPENTKPVSNEPTITEKPKTTVQATTMEKTTPSSQNNSVIGRPDTGLAKPTDAESNPSNKSKSGSQAARTDKAATPSKPDALEKVKPTAEKPVNDGGGEIPEVKPNEAKKPDTGAKTAEKAKTAEQQSKNTDAKKVQTANAATEAKHSSETVKPVENTTPEAKAKTTEANDGTETPVVQAPHSLGGESANQFTPPLPEGFLKEAQVNVDDSKHDNGSNSPSKEVNSMVENAEDLLLAPIIPRPKKRPAAKSLLKQLGQSPVARPLKKVKAVNAKPEKKSAGRAKSPGRGRPSKAASGSSSASGKAKMLSEGPPTEDLEGGWPEGWVRRVFERASGATKGTTDKYWYSPIDGIKLRSIVEGKGTVFCSIQI